MTDLSPLFEPFDLGPVPLRNRIVMAPMTRMKSPGGSPGEDVAAYYRRRAEGGVGLIISEGTTVNHRVANGYPGVPNFHGNGLAGWRGVVDAVADAGGVIFPQIWHIGMQRVAKVSHNPDEPNAGPSGILLNGKQITDPISDSEVEDIIASFVQAVVDARAIGFPGVELHGAHGYLIDNFFWERTNQRTDRWGGDMVTRTNFAAEIIRRARAAVGPDYPMILRFSQWKSNHYDVKLAPTPEDLDKFLAPLVDAGISCLHASTRRVWEPEFDGSRLNLAGWAKKLTCLPVITVGQVGLDSTYTAADRTAQANFSLDTVQKAADMVARGEVDLVAIGRALIPNPDLVNQLRDGVFTGFTPFSADANAVLY